MDLRVAPNLASFSASGALALGHPAARSPVAPADDSPGCPGFFIFRLCRRMESRVAPNLASFGASGAGALGFPTAMLIRERLPVWLRVAPHPAPSGFALVRVFGSPRILAPMAPADGTPKLPWIPHPPALPSLRLRVSPNPASTAGWMMISRLPSNFASSAEPRMNLRVQSGLANSSPTLDAF
jgi:hypothetical protein